MAALTVKFQLRMTEDEKRMLERMAARVFPDLDHAQSLVIRRLIREAAAREQQKPEAR